MNDTSPIKHYGFAQIPRQILRGEKYRKKLSLAEKGLYTCLKDICGETGECFYSLRNLAIEIGTSASTLTRLIPTLRDTGLIYAEKKIRGTGENKHEIWHIRIANIWEENDALYKPQECFKMEQSSVSNRNNVSDASISVSEGNENGSSDPSLFQNETALFQNETKIVSFCLPNNNNINNNNLNNITVLRTADEPTASQPTIFSSETREPEEEIKSFSPESEAPTAEGNTPQTAKRSTKKKSSNGENPKQKELPHQEEPHISGKAKEVWDLWLKMPWNKLRPPLTETAAKHCENLATVDITETILWEIIRYIRDNDNNGYYKKRAIQLGDLVREYPKWSNAQHTQKLTVPQQGILTQDEKDFRNWLVTQPMEERPKILKKRREARIAAQTQAQEAINAK